MEPQPPQQVKLSAYKVRKAKGEKPITLWFSPKIKALIKLAAKSMGEPETAWCERAIVSALNKWTPPDNEELWPKCGVCGKKHDPTTHWTEGESYEQYLESK